MDTVTLVSENGVDASTDSDVGPMPINLDYTNSDWSGNVDRFEWI